MVICLDQSSNQILSHPSMQSYLEGKDIEGGCPVCMGIEAGRLPTSPQEINVAPATKYIMNFVPLKHRADSKLDWTLLPAQVVPCMANFTIWDGIMEILSNEGNITHPDRATFIRVIRKGTGFASRYDVSIDSESLRKPAKLSDELKLLIADVFEPGIGTCDIYQLVAKLTASRVRVESFITGIRMEDEYVENDASNKEEAVAVDEQTPVQIQSSECLMGERYLVHGKYEAIFLQIKDNVAVFQTDDGATLRVKATSFVVPVDDGNAVSETTASEVPASNTTDATIDPSVAAIRQRLAQRRAAQKTR